jgi:hypothetical protein
VGYLVLCGVNGMPCSGGRFMWKGVVMAYLGVVMAYLLGSFHGIHGSGYGIFGR